MKKQLIDQSAHFIIALAILGLVTLLPNLLTYALAGASLGLIREVTEQGPVTSPGSLLDILFWSLGGLAAGVFFL